MDDLTRPTTDVWCTRMVRESMRRLLPLKRYGRPSLPWGVLTARERRVCDQGARCVDPEARMRRRHQRREDG